MNKHTMLVVFAGLPGVGKSALAKVVSKKTGAIWLRVDTFEASMLKAGIPRSFETGLAAYIGVRDIAMEELRLGHTVIVDAVNGVEEARQMWRELAEQTKVPRYVIEVVCPDKSEHQRRIEARSSSTPPLPVPTWNEVLGREYLPWGEQVLLIDGTQPMGENVERILSYCSPKPDPAR